VLPNPIVFNPKENSKFVAIHSAHIYRVMRRRGIVIQEYEDVINGPEDKTEGTTVSFLGGESQDTPPPPEDPSLSEPLPEMDRPGGQGNSRDREPAADLKDGEKESE
jgi:monofunctional biosynthetic peptidoglycan transglycosylase